VAEQRPPVSRAAVVVNPVKFGDLAQLRSEVSAIMTEHGWAEPVWLETTPEDPGEGQARQAADGGADLVLACGGDGTVTSVAAGLVGRRTALAIVPAGTGNLLARNLGLPMDRAGAIRAAVTGTDRPLDVGLANGRPFIVMAGLGFDAKMLDSASEPLKQRLGWPAYLISAVRHLWDRPEHVSLKADGRPPVRRRASGVIVGNVGRLQGSLPLLPDAQPDDGLLDVMVLTARSSVGWLVVAGHVLLRRRGATARVLRYVVEELRVDADHELPWELDGELMGRTRQLAIAIHPEKLLVRVPAAGAGVPASRRPGRPGRRAAA
jgi:YegS/Rv2252/BmrU family lipid kinase